VKKIINIISSMTGGGAELLVREAHKVLMGRNIDSHAVYINGSKDDLIKNELVLNARIRSPLNILRIRKILKKYSENADDKLIVNVHLAWPFFYSAIAVVGLSNIKMIFTEHSTTNKRRRIPFFWIVERKFYARYDRIICISDGAFNALSKWVGGKFLDRLIRIYNGSRMYSFVRRPKLTKRLPNLISVGGLSHRKNFATVIRAVAKMREDINQYVIVGEGSARSQLEQIIRDNQLQGKVILAGWSDNVEPHLHQADIQIISSLWEGFGLVAVEGMSTGLPIVASNVDGLREVLNESSVSIYLIDHPKSVNEWVVGIKKIIADLRSNDGDYLAMASRKQAEKFTLEQMIDRYLEVYEQV